MPKGISERMAYLLALQVLKNGRGVRVPEPPELDPGTINLHLPNGTLVGQIYTYGDVGGTLFTEHWVIIDPDAFFAPDTTYDMVHLDDGNQGTWANALTAIKSYYDGTNNRPHWSTFQHAAMNISWGTPPSAEDIEDLPDTPGNWEKHEFDVRTLEASNAPVTTGGLFREIHPAGSSHWTDHWRLGPNYARPDEGTGAPDSIVTRVRPATSTRAHLREFLADHHQLGGDYIQVSYDWALLT